MLPKIPRLSIRPCHSGGLKAYGRLRFANEISRCLWRHAREPEAIIKVMLHLRLKNPIPESSAHHSPFPHLRPEFPLKPRIEPQTEREFQIISLPQKDGSFVASVVEAPEILVYHRSRRIAEEKATQRFLRMPDPHAYERHPLATTKTVTIEMEYDQDARAFVTYVKELNRMSTFGETEEAALDN